ncbi:hypothetical protein FZEAL_4495 [Fusarium zealandicum]|uniref:Peptide hydrolase n=1 Tax=Fusarium zealandicum TaxID=1053134 RepID=A0A8H4XLD5_9HYPO|nr:hypothetical protein FZEAL_4495 [Fusarium zealandicum]
MKLLTGLLYGALLFSEASAQKLTASQVEADIDKAKLRKTLEDLNAIANKNGGNRAFGLPGYKASLDYVLGQIQGEYGKFLDTSVQKFTHTFEETRKISLRGPDGEDVLVVALMYNKATPIPGGVTAPLVLVPVDDDRGSGCFEDQWKGVDATNKIALVKRGVCAVSDKLKLAKKAGARGVILVNKNPGNKIIGSTVGAENVDLVVPAGVISLEVGTSWRQRIEKGETLKVTLLVDSAFEPRESWNIISETKEGDPNNVVMLGAHLDSVKAGAGINDDGSAVAALLEVAKSFTKYKGYKNKVRFAWWGAEESGLIGSTYYTQQLSKPEADKIRFYFNYDMIASPNPRCFVQASNDVDRVGGTLLADWLRKNGQTPEWKVSDAADQVPFLKLGIPCSGMSTGADAQADPCYHTKCDDINNINWDALYRNTKAIGQAATQFALSLDGLPPRS